MTESHIVPPSKIKAELNNLWENLENKNKMRASLFNLIFYSNKSPRDEYIRKITQKIIEKFPARIFFISSDITSKENSIKTAVSIMSAEQGEFDVTCDVIEVSTTAATENQVPFIILPHIVPDLPIFLLWGEDPSSSSPLLQELEKFATRVIFDSETAKDLNIFAKSILSIQDKSKCEIADLNWARLESWRDFLSAFFKDNQLFNQLKKTHQLIIKYNAQQTPFFCHTHIQSIYLQAWLATRLHFSFIKSSHQNESISFSYQNVSKESVSVDIVSERHATLPPGLILSVELSNGDNEKFIFERSVDMPNQISCSYSSETVCKMPLKFLIAKGESGQSLVKEICHKGTSNHYLDILNLLSSMEPSGLC
ncbi:MAG: hypothetical protein EBZ47_02480 [Chlamydiae bacterium]|nr:hypothetical protein [Chlamydiota bacterium]